MMEIGSVIIVTEQLIDRIAQALALEHLTDEGRANHGWPNESLWHPDEVWHYRKLALAILSEELAQQNQTGNSTEKKSRD
jgi:hypothetical protein